MEFIRRHKRYSTIGKIKAKLKEHVFCAILIDSF